MKPLLLTFAIISVATFSFGQVTSPFVIASGGSYTANGTLSLSTTIGETAIQTLTVGTFMLSQGFEQPDLEPLNSTLDGEGSFLEIYTYPNPARDVFSVMILGNEVNSAQLTLVDLTGKVLCQQILYFNQIQTVDLHKVACGLYLLKIADRSGTLLGTKKIQKVN